MFNLILFLGFVSVFSATILLLKEQRTFSVVASTIALLFFFAAYILEPAPQTVDYQTYYHCMNKEVKRKQFSIEDLKVVKVMCKAKSNLRKRSNK